MTQFLINCSSLSLTQLRGKNLAISLSAFVCFLATLLILVILVLYRTYRTLLQRLFLYLTSVIAVHLVFVSMDIQLLFDFQYGSQACMIQGFIRSWTATTSYLLVIIITSHLMHLVCHQLLKVKSSQDTCKISNKKFVDVIIVIFTLLLPLTYLWIPFYHNTYGIYATSCWIEKVDRHCQKNIGSLDQIICTSVLRATMIVVIIAIVALFVIFCWSSSQIRNTQMRNVVKQTLYLMAFFLGSFVIEATGLAMYIYSAVTDKSINSYTVWVIYDIAMPFSQLIIPIGLLIYLHSFKKQSLKRALTEWRLCCEASCSSSTCFSKHAGMEDLHRINRHEDCELGESEKTDSKHESQPSYTYFNIEHTGEFTKITDQNACATKYGSLVVTNRYGQKHGRDDISVSQNSDYKSLPSSTNFCLEHTGEFTTVTDCDVCACKKCKRDSNFTYLKNKQELSTSSQTLEAAAGTFARSNSHNAGHEEQHKELDVENSKLAQTSCFSISPPSSHHSLEDTREFIRSSSYSFTKLEGTTVAHKWDKQHEEIELEDSTMTEISGRVSPPSATCFSIEYTGEFTSIMDYDTHI